MKTWVAVLLDSKQSFRTELKKSVLEGMKYFKAEYKESGEVDMTKASTLKQLLSGPISYLLKSKNKEVEKLVKDLKGEKGGLKFVGFTPHIQYIKERGPSEHLEVRWEHEFGSAALVYAHKKLPIIILAGPDIMFDDSMVGNIKRNEGIEQPAGFTG